MMLAANLEIVDGIMVGVRLAFWRHGGNPKTCQSRRSSTCRKTPRYYPFKKAGAVLADDLPLSDMRGSAKYWLLTAQNLLKIWAGTISGKQMSLAGQGLPPVWMGGDMPEKSRIKGDIRYKPAS